MHNLNNFVSSIFIIFLSFSLRCCQLQSPCPNVFEYRYGTTNNANELYGLIRTFLPRSNSNLTILEVQLSVGNTVQGYNGDIQLGAPHADIIADLMNKRPLRYILHFPRWVNIAPKVTKIAINGQEICIGNPVDRKLVPVVTTIKLQHSLTINTPNGPQSQNTHRTIITPKIQTKSKEKPINLITVTPPSNGEWRNFYSKNPFLNEIFPFPDNHQEFDPIMPNNFFPFSSTNLPMVTIPRHISTIPNKFGIENNAPRFSIQPAEVSTIEPNLVTQNPSDICGISVNSNSLLINGKRFTRSLHPWLAALFKQNDEGLKFMCGSSLISQRHVITAAHCIRTRRKKFNPEELWVVLGRENIQRWSNDGAQIIQAQSTHYYPDHQFHTADADIAIIVLSEDVVFSTLVRPVCLWSSNPDENLIVGQNGSVVGWGKDEQGRIFTPEPRLVVMPVVSEETCLRSNSGFREITSNRTFCAGNRDSVGPCNGDSGTGFMIKRFGRWYLRGIVSMSLLGADGNCDLRQYVVFTDAAKYADWIRSILR